ncbi:MAG: toll/interleukin-1 receptor domain-containing protein, partial [Anaerolineae bacterium]|nr:toll/interleukin-1 receptor domain-containing protein [Anaerolineae bacterium]
MAHLFFSYAHDDAERLYPIHARMELVTEHTLWLDRIGLERGTVWEYSIKAAIDDSYGVIFAVTKTFIIRPFILEKEIPWAFERFEDKQGAQLFPILFDDVAVPELLKTPHIAHLIDARDGDMERVYAELKHILPRPQAGTQP